MKLTHFQRYLRQALGGQMIVVLALTTSFLLLYGSSAHAETTAPQAPTQANADGSFSMIIASDPQLWWWREGTDPACSSDECILQMGKESNQRMIDSMNGLKNSSQPLLWPTDAPLLTIGAGQAILPPTGVILNGDLARFGHVDDVALFKSYYYNNKLNYQIWPGLGNHDIANNLHGSPIDIIAITQLLQQGGNVPGCTYEDVFFPDYNRCGKNWLWWMGNQLTRNPLPNLISKDVSGFVAVHNLGAFVARVSLSYQLNGQTYTQSPDRFLNPRWQTVTFPAMATNIHIVVEEDTGVGWRTLKDFTMLSPEQLCYELTGTTLNPDRRLVTCPDEWPNGSSGSLAYSFEIGNYHFVQLHYWPGYDVGLESVELPLGPFGTNVYDPKTSPGFHITPSYNWLAQDVAKATAAGKKIVINMHDAVGDLVSPQTYYPSGNPYGIFYTDGLPYYNISQDTFFRRAITNTNVVAIFAGHIHEVYGNYETFSNGRYEIPVILSGSAECQRYLVSEFHDGYFNVGVIKSNAGTDVLVPWTADGPRDVCDITAGVKYHSNSADPQPRTYPIKLAGMPDYRCETVSQIPFEECVALRDLFVNTNGLQWASNLNWFQNNTPCNWLGVVCSGGHVTILNLSNSGLRGLLPATLGNLTQLTELNLSDNQLSGPIPTEVGFLLNLTNLRLDDNQLQGVIPATLGNLASLRNLSLSNNQLHGPLSPNLMNLIDLQNLGVSYNALDTDSSAIANFLRSKQATWADTQTMAPRNLQVQARTATSVKLSWMPIAYSGDGGYYQVFLASQAAGPYSYIGRTADKQTNLFVVGGLTPGLPVWLQMRTFTPAHGIQQNDLTSDLSLSATGAPFVNHPPLAVNDSYATSVNSVLTLDSAHGLIANDSDPDGIPDSDGRYVGAALVTPPTHGLLALHADGSFVYTPTVGFAGVDSFTYQAVDGLLPSSAATVTITVGNAAQAQITIVLDVQPDSVTNFNFNGSLGAFLLDDITPQDKDAYSNSKSFTVPAGTYTVTEQLISGYLDANIFCSPPAGTIADLTKHQIVINTASGANITCTFVAQRAGQIIAGKYNDHNHNHLRNSSDEWLNGWQMGLHSPFTSLVATQVTAGEGRTVFNNLFAGTYTVCEVPQTGWVAITPNAPNTTYNAPCYTVNVAAGQAVWVRFGNSNTPLVAAAEETPSTDIVVCDLPATDDDGNELTVERDPWEEEEETLTHTLFLPLATHP